MVFRTKKYGIDQICPRTPCATLRYSTNKYTTTCDKKYKNAHDPKNTRNGGKEKSFLAIFRPSHRSTISPLKQLKTQ
jgi:hypothetical protein